jgi:transcriptional regulator with XRE-family HTH domain
MLKSIRIIDVFDGWKSFCADRLTVARNTLPEESRPLKKISEVTGISIPQLSNYFRGREIPHLKNFKKLCLYLQVPADFLLGLKIEEIT